MQVDKDLFLFIYLILMAAAVSSEASQLTVLSRLARQALQDRIGVYIWYDWWLLGSSCNVLPYMQVLIPILCSFVSSRQDSRLASVSHLLLRFSQHGTHQNYSKISQPQIKIAATIGYDYSKLSKHSFKATTTNLRCGRYPAPWTDFAR